MARPPAPGDLAVVQAFLNTNDREGHVDELDDPAALRGWLVERDLLTNGDSSFDHGDVATATRFREALRDLLEAHHADPPRPVAADLFARHAAAAGLVTRFDASGHGRLEATASGLDGALGNLLAMVYTAMSDGSWYRLKVCQRDVCRWAFYDHSKNRSSTWCSMAVCGNKEKAAAYRARHSARSPASG